MPQLKPSDFKFTGQRPDFSALDTKQDQGFSDDELDDLKKDLADEIESLQNKMYAQSKHSILLVLQAMDAAGKDSTIEKLTLGMNAQGCQIHSFKKPTDIEMAHDFLWRVHKRVPAQGEITLFNRSHYEDVLIVKVHEWVDQDTIEQRYEYINAFESQLQERGTKVIKIMLNVSPEYQLSRFTRRLEKPGKNWKFNPGDLKERAHWDDYMVAFADAIENCACESAPWYIIPAENRDFRDAIIAKILHEALLEIDPRYPEPDYDHELYTAESIKDM